MKIQIYFLSLYLEVVLGSKNAYYSEVDPGTYTYIATIMNMVNKDVPKPICIGTIIHTEHVLTSCRCKMLLPSWKEDFSLDQVKVVAGDVNLYFNFQDPESSSHRQTRVPKKWAHHNKCQKGDTKMNVWHYDYSFIHLRWPFVFNHFVGMVDLITQQHYGIFKLKVLFFKKTINLTCRKCRSVGRATYKYLEKKFEFRYSSDVLWSQEVDVIADDLCVRMFCKNSKRKFCPTLRDLESRHVVCVKSPESYRMCDGDMGAPLVCQGDVYGYLLGVPYGNCSNNNYPLMYTSHADNILFVINETYEFLHLSAAYGWAEFIPKTTIFVVQMFLAIKSY